VSDPLAFQTAQRTPELLGLIADDMRPKLAVRSKSIAILAEPLRQVEDDRLGEELVLLSQGNERFSEVFPLRRSVATFGSGYKHFMRMNRHSNLLGPEYCPLSQPSE
jgi:hypothetical protein